MDFSNRDVQTHHAAPGTQITPAGPPHGPANIKKANHSEEKGDWIRVVTVILVGALVILLCAVIALISSDNSRSRAAALNTETQFVKTDKLQAIFLKNDQVYFGNIKNLNSQYIVLGNTYYIQPTNSDGSTGTKAATSATLVKMGCELHEPYDQIIINRDQVSFWENLQDDGQVAKLVSAFEKKNPDGLKCVDQSASSGATSNSAQPAATSGATTNH